MAIVLGQIVVSFRTSSLSGSQEPYVWYWPRSVFGLNESVETPLYPLFVHGPLECPVQIPRSLSQDYACSRSRVRFDRMQSGLDCFDPLRPNARQMVKDLLLKVCKTNDLSLRREQFDAPPSIRPRILCFIDNDQWKAFRDEARG